MTVFTPHQDAALKAVAAWLKAGRGKAQRRRCSACSAMPAPARPRWPATSPTAVDGKVLFAAFTGKAALVMRSKGCERASTIHSLIYKTRESGEEVPSFDLWDDAPASKAA